MKIQSFIDPFRFLGNKTEKTDTSGGGAGGNGQTSGDPNSRKKKTPEEATADGPDGEVVFSTILAQESDVQDAIESFNRESELQKAGIRADRVSGGPGLKVVLKDQNGNVLRQLSGEDLIKLRTDQATEPPKRGRLLDQKA